MMRSEPRADGGGGPFTELLYFLAVLAGAVLAAFAVLRPGRGKSDSEESR